MLLKDGEKLPSLDGLRGISIILVMLVHIRVTAGFPTFLEAPLREAGFGVEIFFVISGFLISYLLMAEEYRTRKNDILRFYLKRVLRVVPAFLVYLAFILLQPFEKVDIDIKSLIHIFTFTINFDPNATWVVRHFWTLGIEEQFYILWPLLFLLFKNHRKTILILTILYSCVVRVLNYKYGISEFTLYPFFYISDSIMIGVLGGIYIFENPNVLDSSLFKSIRYQLAAIVIILVLLTLFHFKIAGYITIPFKITITSICILYLILSNIRRSDNFIYQILNNRILSYIGLMSYSLYLWQQFFLNGRTMCYRR
ncbi:MAG: acyltransferase [Pedobacter sp.]|nr:MAG: acyltransferase [Pedobacter sp.]